MATNGNVLLWCASPVLCRNIRHYLQGNAFAVLSCTTAEELRIALSIDDYLLLITDISLTVEFPETLLERQPDLTVLHISENEADTSLPKNHLWLHPPFDMNEIGLILQHQNQPAEPQELPLGKYVILPKEKRIRYQNKEFPLSKKEMELLLLLYRNHPEVISKETICHKLWPESPLGKENSIYVYINNIRNCLSDDPTIRLIAVYGKGFRIEMP